MVLMQSDHRRVVYNSDELFFITPLPIADSR